MSNVWDARAAAYVDSDAHRGGADLEQLVAWAEGARSALDVATGGGHVARRLLSLKSTRPRYRKS